MTTVLDVQRFKEEGRRFAVLTAYDYLSAKILDEAGIPDPARRRQPGHGHARLHDHRCR